jgi:hypothetical protein
LGGTFGVRPAILIKLAPQFKHYFASNGSRNNLLFSIRPLLLHLPAANFYG